MANHNFTMGSQTAITFAYGERGDVTYNPRMEGIDFARTQSGRILALAESGRVGKHFLVYLSVDGTRAENCVSFGTSGVVAAGDLDEAMIVMAGRLA